MTWLDVLSAYIAVVETARFWMPLLIGAAALLLVLAGSSRAPGHRPDVSVSCPGDWPDDLDTGAG